MKINIRNYRYSIIIVFILVIFYLLGFLISGDIDFNRFLYSQYVIAFIIGYVLLGIIADFLTNLIVRTVWQKTTTSWREVHGIKKPIPLWLDSEKRKHFSWAPRMIGVLERFLYTTAIIFNQFALIGIWLVFKAIGDWSDFSSTKNKEDDRGIKEGTTRIRANNFLIGTGITLIFGILGGVLFRYTLDQNFLVNLIKTSYPTVK